MSYLSTTERGTFNNDTTPPTVNSEMYSPTMDDMLFPYPTNEIQNNPALQQPPVPYNFGE